MTFVVLVAKLNISRHSIQRLAVIIVIIGALVKLVVAIDDLPFLPIRPNESLEFSVLVESYLGIRPSFFKVAVRPFADNYEVAIESSLILTQIRDHFPGAAQSIVIKIDNIRMSIVRIETQELISLIFSFLKFFRHRNGVLVERIILIVSVS